LNSKTREHRRIDSKDSKGKEEENNLLFLLFTEIERLLVLLNERDMEIDHFKQINKKKIEEEMSEVTKFVKMLFFKE